MPRRLISRFTTIKPNELPGTTIKVDVSKTTRPFATIKSLRTDTPAYIINKKTKTREETTFGKLEPSHKKIVLEKLHHPKLI